MKTSKKKKMDWVDDVKVKKIAKAKAREKMERAKITLNFKVKPSEAQIFRTKAVKLANGNLTQMIKLAIHAWAPTKKDIQGIRKSTRA